MTDNYVASWNTATAALPWGVQGAFKTALQAVADGDIKMVYGANVKNGSPCLVNAISNMVSQNHTGVNPVNFAPAVVSAFDSINAMLREKGVNKDDGLSLVSPFAAEILLQHFGKDSLKELMDLNPPYRSVEPESVDDKPYVETSDETLMKEWLAAQASTTECPIALTEPSDFNVDEFAKVREFIFNDE